MAGRPSPTLETPDHLGREPESVQVPNLGRQEGGLAPSTLSESRRRIRVRQAPQFRTGPSAIPHGSLRNSARVPCRRRHESPLAQYWRPMRCALPAPANTPPRRVHPARPSPDSSIAIIAGMQDRRLGEFHYESSPRLLRPGSNGHHPAPKLPAPFIHVPVGPSHNLDVRPEPEPGQDDRRRLRHRLLGPGHNIIDRVGRPLDHQGVMDRGHDGDSPLRRQATRQPHHLGPVRLAWEIAERTRVGVGANADRPTENGMEPTQEHRMGLGPVRPSPESPDRSPDGAGATPDHRPLACRSVGPTTRPPSRTERPGRMP